MFTIIIPFMYSNEYRIRNLREVLKSYKKIAPEFKLILVEQNGDGKLSRILSNEFSWVQYINVKLSYETFHKTYLLNKAIEKVKTEYIIMADADCIVTETTIQSIKTEYDKGSILYPFNSVDYYGEAHTRIYANTQSLIPNKTKVNKGLALKRFTGMLNCFSKQTYEYIGKFDNEFIGWGGEDDAFIIKCQRLIGDSYRTQIESPLVHLYHSVADTSEYKIGNLYLNNRKRLAVITRMNIEDLQEYSKSKVTLEKLIDKYTSLNKMNLDIKWKINNCVINIDSTIYDIHSIENPSITQILNAIYIEDGIESIKRTLNIIDSNAIGLNETQIQELNYFRNLDG